MNALEPTIRPSAPKPPDWVDRGLKSHLAAAAALSLGVKLGQESRRLWSGEIDRHEFRRRTSFHVGTVCGTMTGAGIGAVIGRLWPGPGRVVGAFVGGMMGEIFGERIGRATVDRVWKAGAPAATEVPVEPIDDSPPERSRREL